jgi:hypothetical protein
MNHWYHMDMNYRSPVSICLRLLRVCWTIRRRMGALCRTRKSCAHKRGWAPLAFALDWNRPPRQQNSTSLFLCPHGPMALRNIAKLTTFFHLTADHKEDGMARCLIATLNRARADRMACLSARNCRKTLLDLVKTSRARRKRS